MFPLKYFRCVVVCDKVQRYQFYFSMHSWTTCFSTCNCNLEDLLQDIRSLIHADNTIIPSTDKHKFIQKCNLAMKCFEPNILQLNIGKCKYIVINPSKAFKKENLVLGKVILKYSDTLKYLGVYISSDGLISKDVKYYLNIVRPTVTIKYTNFCILDRNAPLHVELDVLDKCATPSLLYGCEVWEKHFRDVEIIYRSGIKAALGINNEIVYIELGKYPLESKIKLLQYKLWSYINCGHI